MNSKFWKDKRVSVTGHTGFKGSWLTIWLKKLGADITGFSKSVPTNPSLFEIVNIEKDNKSIKLGLLSPGDAFGEFSLLTGDQRTATVKATNHLQCLEISKEALQDIIDKNPSLIDNLALIMAEREQNNKKINDDNKKLSAKEIIDYYKAEFNRKIKSFFNRD